MKPLNNILYGVSLQAVAGSTDIPVAGLAFDSRQVKPGYVFVAVPGTQVDGHQFIDQAVAKGAVAVVGEKMPEQRQEGITYIETSDSARALGIMAHNFYDSPSTKLKLVGITGTNGKTTVATLLYNLFTAAGHRCGLLATTGNKIGGRTLPATHTTPDALQLNSLLADMVADKCEYCFMEVSSHALQQARTAGLQYAGAVFTNLSHDHLDYHGNFEAYIKAKKKLFDGLNKDAFALVNIDDKRGRIMLQNCPAKKYHYALRSPAAFRARIISNGLEGLELDIDGRQVWFRLFGVFNAYNLLAVYGTAVLLGMDEDSALTLMSGLEAAPGRLEQVPNEQGVIALVDYAHTPDALQSVLQTIGQFRTGNEQLITVVGCGGDRDKEKRPLMAGIACKHSDKVIFTSDNPRSEDPEQIIDEMIAGVSAAHKRKVLRITDRAEAIKTACMLAHEKDIILVAGKGHETYQEINGERLPFDDRKVLSQMLTTTHN